MLETVEVQSKATQLLQEYRSLFEERHKIKPELDVPRSMEILRGFIDKLGMGMSFALVRSYFKSQDPWIIKKAHPLEYLQKNINEILILVPEYRDRAQQTKRKLIIRGELACDSCWKHFTCDYDANTDLQTVWIRCPLCLECNAPWKYPTQEEFQKNWQRFGMKVPSYEKIFKTKEPYPQRPDLVYLNPK